MDAPDDTEELLRAIAALAPSDGAAVDVEFLRAATAHMPALLVVCDPSARFLWVNRTIPGLALEDVLGREVYDFVPPADQPSTRAAIERAVRTAQPDRYEGYGPGKRGPRSRYENWIAPIASDGRVIALALITRDVSEEWEVHERLRDREQRLSLALQAAGMGMWRMELKTKTLELDERARAIYGIDVERLPALEFAATYLHPDDRAQADAAAFAAMRELRPYRSENRVVRKDGTVRWVAVTGAPVLDERGALVALLGTLTDVTDRHELEDRSRQTQKLEAIGQLTAGIAHNFNNVLAAIVPALEIVEPEVTSESVPLVQGAAHAAQRAAQLVRDLMTFAGRSRRQERTAEEPRTIVERTLRLCRPTFERGIRLEVEIDPDIPHVLVDTGQIEQAILNILINARDAVREGGRAGPRVTVRARVEIDAADATTRWVAISVEDDGPGMEDAVRERVFDPFFTTKDVGRGTGLGLSTAYAIVREHGGSIRCESAPGRGSCFTVLLPAAAAHKEAAPAGAPQEKKAAVLVVDDEPLVRAVVRRVLGGAGYAIVEASSGEEALAKLAGEEGIAVVVLGHDRTGPAWRLLVDRIRGFRRSVRVVGFGGGGDDAEVDAADRDAVDGWLQKPAAPSAIVETVAETLARPRA